MKKWIAYIIWVCFFVGCNKEDARDIVKTRGAAKTEVRGLPHFNQLHIANGVNVILRHGESNSATLEGWTNLLPKVRLTVDATGILSISDDNRFNQIRDLSNKTTVYLSYRDEIDFIGFYGDGLLTSDGKVESSSLTILSEGASGSIGLTLDVGSLYVGTNSKNTADLTFTGICYSVGITNWGFAPIDMRNMQAQHADITHRGTADLHVFVDQHLNAVLYGIGNIYYKGNPVLTVDRKGKGNVYKIP